MDTEVSEPENHEGVTTAYARYVQKYAFILTLTVVLTIFLVALFIQYINRPDSQFPLDEVILIPEGLTASDVTQLLDEKRVVRSSLYLSVILQSEFEDKFIQAGEYIFSEPLTTKEIAAALTSGTHGKPSVVLTFPEGLKGREILNIIQNEINEDTFSITTEQLDAHIGYLFPDTYFVSENVTPDELITLMRDTFDTKTAHLESAINESVLTQDGIIILASLVEREANTEESMRTVAGILWTRLTIGMPLQVDATFEFLLGKESSELTQDDLTIDSPYNTYTNKGLPPTSIANPGLQAIEAVLNPIDSEFLYYLTDKDGVFHYSETFERHKQNKERYLR